MSKYSIHLTKTQREGIEQLIHAGTAPARSIMHAHVLLKSDKGPDGPRWTDRKIHEAFGVGESTMKRIRQRFLSEGLEAALQRRKQPERPTQRKLQGEQEAHLVLLACSEPPVGQMRWTMQVLRERLIELHIVESISDETVRLTLKKNALKPWQTRQWCIGKANAKFVAAMEDVLAVYQRAYNPQVPVVCVDEGSKQLVHALREALPMRVGQSRREDYEYKRDGFCSVFMACEPLAGQRVVQVRARRTKQDWAEFMRMVLEEHYPEVTKVVLVMDNLNTHSTASFYETYPPEVARRLSERLEVHYTPLHGSWLNMAEIELSVLSRQVLAERMQTLEQVQAQVQGWQDRRNRRQSVINWQFTNEQARIQLKRLYPSNDDW